MLARHLTAWAAQRGGQCVAGAGVEIGADQLIPDVAVIGPDRVREVDEDGFHVPPDLVAEVTSPGTRSLDLTEKAAIYAESGVAEYWVVDPTQGRVVVHRVETDRGAAAGTGPGPGAAAGAGEAATYAITEHRDGTLTPLVAPDLAVPVAELLAV